MSFKVSSYNDIPVETAIEAIPAKVESARQGFRSNKTIPLSYRKEQLRNLYYGIYDNLDVLYKALYQDLHKGQLETDLAEIGFVLNEITYFINNLDKLAKPEKAPLDLIMQPATAHVFKQPFGTVLIIAPWNYPLVLSISPIAAALAGGNTVVYKASELVPNVSRALIKILQTALDASIFVGITGAIPQSTALLKEKFDKILYTGNGTVGRIVSRAAAEHLTPVLLELGGKSPCIITKHADLRIAARRILWGKQLNAGQTCVAPDYILVDASVKSKFIEELRKAYKEYFPKIDSETEHTHIVSDRHFARISGLLENSKGKIIVGGESDPSTRFMAPTFLDGIDADDSLMSEELFGPLIGLITVKDTQDAIDFIIKEHDTPLALYIFSNNKAEQLEIISKTRSGGVGINDPLMQVSLVTAPLAGVGASGNGGGYHGKYGFDAFTHKRTVFSQSVGFMDRLLSVRNPPYSKSQTNQFHSLSAKAPPFPRTGPIRKGFLRTVLGSSLFWAGILLALAAAKYRS